MILDTTTSSRKVVGLIPMPTYYLYTSMSKGEGGWPEHFKKLREAWESYQYSFKYDTAN